MDNNAVWAGETPRTCDVCEGRVIGVFVDGKTQMGPWACMCMACFQSVGVGLGTGKGQKYACGLDGRFVKVAG